jgi:hypothetical protein
MRLESAALKSPVWFELGPGPVLSNRQILSTMSSNLRASPLYFGDDAAS